jgi:uncharacterized membrane protein YphA (DoxX/SURF4 family)
MKTGNSDLKMNSAIGKSWSVLLEISRVLLGSVFIFSGFVKAIDPLGSTYKFEDYFHAFGGFFESLVQVSFPLAILLSTLELVIGLNLILKVYTRLTNISALLFMLVMTPLTLYIAFKDNLVTDCGCFGDALVISNWATFYKNIVLLAMVLLLIVSKQHIRTYFSIKSQHIAFGLFCLITIGLSAYCYLHLPIIDFRPFKVGVNIPDAMQIPEDAPMDVFETTFIYEKDGLQKEFTLENYPKEDSTWIFVDQKSKLVTEGYRAPIHGLSIIDAQYDDITEDIIYDSGETYLLIIYDVAKASEKGTVKAEMKYQESLKNGIKFYALTASSDDEVHTFKEKTGVTFPFCKTDPITLKTIIRANPGLVLIKNGTIMGKWNWRDFE